MVRSYPLDRRQLRSAGRRSRRLSFLVSAVDGSYPNWPDYCCCHSGCLCPATRCRWSNASGCWDRSWSLWCWRFVMIAFWVMIQGLCQFAWNSPLCSSALRSFEFVERSMCEWLMNGSAYKMRFSEREMTGSSSCVRKRRDFEFYV